MTSRRRPVSETHHAFHRMRALVEFESGRPYPSVSTVARGEQIVNPASADPSRPFLRNQMAHSNRFIPRSATVVDPHVRLHPGPRLARVDRSPHQIH